MPVFCLPNLVPEQDALLLYEAIAEYHRLQAWKPVLIEWFVERVEQVDQIHTYRNGGGYAVSLPILTSLDAVRTEQLALRFHS